MACKVVDDPSSEAVRRLWRVDVETLSRLRSRFIVQYRGAIGDAHKIGVLMELRANRSVRDRAVELTEAQQLQVACDALRGLQYLHSLGAQHRNLKATNVLLGADRRAALSGVRGALAAYGSVSPSVMVGVADAPPVECAHEAPELLLSQATAPPFSAASDVYAFGILCWELFTGQRPFAAALAANARSKKPLTTRRVLKKLLKAADYFQVPAFEPAAVCALVRRCVALKPAARPGVPELIAAFDKLLAAASQPRDALASLPRIEPGLLKFEQLKGGGAFSTVWKAEHQDTLAFYAVKVLSRVADAAAARRMLESEARLMRRVQDTGPTDYVVRLEGVTEKDGRPALVMQFMAGGSLADYVLVSAEAPPPLKTRLTLALHAALGLHHLHRQGIVHRDIKSGNVFLDHTQRSARIGDLGLAAMADAGDDSSAQGSLAGSYCWMALELEGGEFSVRSDVFAFGVLLWELVSWRLPFSQCANKEAVFDDVVDDGLREAIPGWCAPELRKLIERCWAQEAVERPQLMAPVVRGLRACLTAPWVGEQQQVEEKRPERVVPDWSAGEVMQSVFAKCSDSVYALALSPDGKHLFSGGADKTVKMWNVESGKVVRSFGHARGVGALALSPDGQHLFSGSRDKTVMMWIVESGKEVRSFQGHSWSVKVLALSPDGKHLFSGSVDKTVKMWNVESGKEVRSFEGHTRGVNALALSPHGKHLFSGSGDKTVKMLNVESGKEVRSFEGHTHVVQALALSPDGIHLFSGSYDKTVKMWNVESCKEVRSFKGHTRFVTALALSPDGKHLFSGSTHKTVRICSVGYAASQDELVAVLTDALPAKFHKDVIVHCILPHLGVVIEGADAARVSHVRRWWW